MHPDANARAIVWLGRHIHTLAIEQNTYLGNDCEPSEKGLLQVGPYEDEILRINPDFFLSSDAVRAATTMMRVNDSPALKISSKIYGEWPRAEKMYGLPNSSPEVDEYLRSRIERFGPSRKNLVLPGEEPWKITRSKMREIEHFIISNSIEIYHRERRAARFFILGHGNRSRQINAWLLSGGDTRKFVRRFKQDYANVGMDPASILPPLWYGQFFREGRVGWNRDEGINRHLPRELRDSQI
ncbi:MAG: hypothetical protein JWN49_52 [Parcubacteria group bacterium]|nr:hypothetical protein [Parcubacteria group bacterium]